MMVDPRNATAMVMALADLARDGGLDLADCDMTDIAAVHAALATWLAMDPEDDARH